MYDSVSVGLRMMAVRYFIGYNQTAKSRSPRPLSQDAFAGLLTEDRKLERSNVSKWENGRVYPPEAVLKMLFLNYGISADWILFEAWNQLRSDLVEPLRAALEEVRSTRAPSE